MVWHKDASFDPVDLIVLPGGFSYGDYLRCGAMAAKSPVMKEVVDRARKGTPVLGICNGFQVLTECGLLPGILMRNANLKFVCRDIHIRVETSQSLFTCKYDGGQTLRIPVAHHDGNYFIEDEELAALEDQGQIAFRYSDAAALFKDRMRLIPQAADDLKLLAQEGLTWVDEQMAGRDFIASDRFSLADITLFAFLEFGGQVGQGLDASLGNLGKWFERVKERPSVAASQ